MTTSPLRRPLYEGGMSPVSAEEEVSEARARVLRASSGVTVLRLPPGSPPLSSEMVAVLESPPPEEQKSLKCLQNFLQENKVTDYLIPR